MFKDHFNIHWYEETKKKQMIKYCNLIQLIEQPIEQRIIQTRKTRMGFLFRNRLESITMTQNLLTNLLVHNAFNLFLKNTQNNMFQIHFKGANYTTWWECDSHCRPFKTITQSHRFNNKTLRQLLKGFIGMKSLKEGTVWL